MNDAAPFNSANTGFSLDLPDWAVDELNQLPATLPSNEERMSAVIKFSRLNFQRNSGGPFAAGIFERDSGRLVVIGCRNDDGRETRVCRHRHPGGVGRHTDDHGGGRETGDDTRRPTTWAHHTPTRLPATVPPGPTPGQCGDQSPAAGWSRSGHIGQSSGTTPMREVRLVQ